MRHPSNAAPTPVEGARIRYRPSMPMDKRALRTAIVARLDAELEALRERAEAIRKDATHEEARAENDKDTRGLEQSYLARGQAARFAELEEVKARLEVLPVAPFGPDDPITVGALVSVEIDGEDERDFLMVPTGGGMEIEHEGRAITLLTTTSPVGRALLRLRTDDEVEVRVGPRTREYLVLAVC